MEPLTKNIVKAIIATAKAAPNLAKDNENKFGKYNYVSIDDYYSQISRLALANGLSWVIRETACLMSEKHIQFTYSFTLFHESGDCAPNVTSFTVVHPLQGAQSSGSAASYAEKMFMRTVFKVITGEQDADATDSSFLANAFKEPSANKTNAVIPQKNITVELPPPDLVKSAERAVVFDADNGGYFVKNFDFEVNDADNIAYEIAKIFAPMCEDEEELKTFRSKNAHVWDYVKNKSPEVYKKIVKVFVDQMNKLKAG